MHHYGAVYLINIYNRRVAVQMAWGLFRQCELHARSLWGGAFTVQIYI